MGNSFRVDRVGMEIKREVNEILQKKVRDPRVQDVTITDVQMLGDLSAAKIFYTIHSTLASDNQKAQTGLEKATGTIKRELGKKLTMYKIPDLTFIKDESIEYGNKIWVLIWVIILALRKQQLPWVSGLLKMGIL